MSTDRAPIEARGVCVRLGGRDIVRDVSFDVDAGQLVALLGANGAGKTTLFRALLGLVPLTAGRVELDGTAIGQCPARELRSVRQRVGFVPQRLGLVAPLSALGNVLLGRLGHGTWGALPLTASRGARRAAMEALDRVGIADHAARPVAALSGGQQQRVALARMLIQDPTVILADEPVASLDPRAAADIMALLRGLVDDGRTVLVTLHQLQHVDGVVDRVIGLRDGEILVTAAADGFLADRAAELYATPA